MSKEEGTTRPIEEDEPQRRSTIGRHCLETLDVGDFDPVGAEARKVPVESQLEGNSVVSDESEDFFI